MQIGVMLITYSDEEIEELIKERKSLESGWRNKLVLRRHRLCEQAFMDMKGQEGNRFRIIMRRNTLEPEDFSAVLVVFPHSRRNPFRLRRYNGPHHHYNAKERTKVKGCHIHMATQRYQESGLKEDGYAVPTERFSDLENARACLFEDCAVDIAPDSQHEVISRTSP